ncbi:MAG: acyl-CoA dehydrogenase C-terminal domain-containing protein [Rhodospirillaceae bacterium]|nr:acyl-CoA dehydrogenase C-terminal domain-containing protein [Rhodospirillaceae bacterium]
MIVYKAPLNEIAFALRELADVDALSQLPGFEDASPELTASILEEAGRIAEKVLLPLSAKGDTDGAKMIDGKVVCTKGWDDAYKVVVEGNWIGLPATPEFGGMGLPRLLNAAVNEMWQSSNSAFLLNPMLTQGAVDALETYGSPEQKAMFLPKLISGEWAGTMDLTEDVAGSDLGALRCKAVKQGDHYLISGQKVFITYGDQDMTDNIIHLVLARTPDAPPGVKGISLFIVPKYRINPDGSQGAFNDVRCISLEHKMGIHGSPTATLAFGENDGAIGYLIGEEGRGLQYMFVMMNDARLHVGIQAVGIAERAYQQALSFARERIQGRAIGAKTLGTIIDHPEVRRMLMEMKSQIEAMRALSYMAAGELDKAHAAPEPEARDKARRRGEFLTPIVKAWCSELVIEIATRAIQTHGGAGYIEETGAPQQLRDSVIASIYEGTNAIQAADLVYRKILGDKGAVVTAYLGEMKALAAELAGGTDATLQPIGQALARAVATLEAAVAWLAAPGTDDPRVVAAAAMPVLYVAGYALGGFQMARAARAAKAKLAAGEGDPAFYDGKIKTARFYAEHILPKAEAHLAAITKGSCITMDLAPDQF